MYGTRRTTVRSRFVIVLTRSWDKMSAVRFVRAPHDRKRGKEVGRGGMMWLPQARTEEGQNTIRLARSTVQEAEVRPDD